MICWSYGGGVQTAAIAVLIREGRLPVPDLAVIADTGRERRTTWEYLHGVIEPYLAPMGLVIQVAPHTLATVDLYAKDGLTLMPAWTEQGRLPTYCSVEWKRRVVNRWLRAKGVESCDCWIGYSIDEIRRVPRKDAVGWCRYQFPLIDLMINRVMCLALIERAGLPRPLKSRCWQCPHQTPEEWAEVRADAEEWAAAVAIDRQIREKDPEGSGELYLYSGRVPLEQADFSATGATIGRVCEGGSCFT